MTFRTRVRFPPPPPTSMRSAPLEPTASALAPNPRLCSMRGFLTVAATGREMGLELLREALGDATADFRDGQWEAIDALVNRRERLLVVQRTGWGKSVVYFIATRMIRNGGGGPTLIITPLLSLMRNQHQAAVKMKLATRVLNSENHSDHGKILADFGHGKLDALLVAPERLADPSFEEALRSPIGLFVVDEAHCISDWGHDFRPDYRRITRILQSLPRTIPVLATTATANDRVVSDVVAQVGSGLRVQRGPLIRESLRLQNIWLPKQAARMAWLAEQLPRLPGSGIIYTLTVRDADRLADWLRQRGIAAYSYHGDTEAAQRERLEQHLLGNEVK